ncbi:hypothetical protein SGPA1_10091 [Streptomyces misionensis JCM 4497]
MYRPDRPPTEKTEVGAPVRRDISGAPERSGCDDLPVLPPRAAGAEAVCARSPSSSGTRTPGRRADGSAAVRRRVAVPSVDSPLTPCPPGSTLLGGNPSEQVGNHGAPRSGRRPSGPDAAAHPAAHLPPAHRPAARLQRHRRPALNPGRVPRTRGPRCSEPPGGSRRHPTDGPRRRAPRTPTTRGDA